MIINGFLGIRNTSPVRSIPDRALSAAFDVDIDNAGLDATGANNGGIILQRNGFAHSVVLSNVTSAYSTLDQAGYVVAGGVLYQFRSDLSYVAIASCSATNFTDYGKNLFTNDGLHIVDGVAFNIKIPSPAQPPDIALTSGSLPAGAYSACYTYRSLVSGIEGGSSPLQTVELTDAAHSFTLSSAAPPSGYEIRYYVTDAGGAVYYDVDGVQLQQSQILANPFPDDVEQIAWHDSRLWVSKTLPSGGSCVWFSDPFLYHSYDFVENYLLFPGQVLGMASTPSGLVIGTDAALYLCDENSAQPLANYGVIAGRPITRLPDGSARIHTRRGECAAMPFQNLTENKCSLAPGVSCSTAMVEQNGIRKFMVLTDGSGVPYNASF